LGHLPREGQGLSPRRVEERVLKRSRWRGRWRGKRRWRVNVIGQINEMIYDHSIRWDKSPFMIDGGLQ